MKQNELNRVVQELRAICAKNNIKKFYYNVTKKGVTIDVELKEETTQTQEGSSS